MSAEGKDNVVLVWDLEVGFDDSGVGTRLEWLLDDVDTVGLDSEVESGWGSDVDLEDHTQTLGVTEIQVLSGEDDFRSEVTEEVDAVKGDGVQFTSVNSPFVVVGKWGTDEVDHQRTEVEHVLGVLSDTAILELVSDVHGVWLVVQDTT